MPMPPMMRAAMNTLDVPGEGASDRGDDVQHADPEQRGAATEPVGGPAADERADHRAVERGTHRDAVDAGTQSPERLDRLLGARDDDGVEAEQKAGERGGDRPVDEAAIHRPRAHRRRRQNDGLGGYQGHATRCSSRCRSRCRSAFRRLLLHRRHPHHPAHVPSPPPRCSARASARPSP